MKGEFIEPELKIINNALSLHIKSLQRAVKSYEIMGRIEIAKIAKKELHEAIAVQAKLQA